MAGLLPGYVAEIDRVDSESWYRHLDRFADANIYQTWDWGVEHKAVKGVSHLVLRRSGQVAAVAQVRLFGLPFVSGGLAHIRWGPIWQAKAGENTPELFDQVLRALKNEYVIKRKMCLRILPRISEPAGGFSEILQREGFCRMEHRAADRTLLVDLSPPLEEIRSKAAQKWRNCLNKAEKQQLVVRVGTLPEDFEEFEQIYEALLLRKAFSPTSDFGLHKRLQAHLPERFKMLIVTCLHEGQPCASGVLSCMGDTGVYLFGSTNETGMRTCASYLVQWQFIRLLRERSVRQYDLHGINPESNPGTYRFKKGLAGKTGREVQFLGTFQAFVPSLGNYLLLALDELRHRSRRRK